MQMQATIKWVDGMQFVAESGSGHSITIDGASKVGGHDTGMRPMETLLVSMGGCSAMDVIFILKKSRQNVTDCKVTIKGERTESVPKVYEKIHIHYAVSGVGLDEKQVARAVNLSAEKYCSVTLMLKKSVPVTHDFLVHQI